jgi:hypothetical protein
MGASLAFHSNQTATAPAVYLTHIYEKFGFPFDHIYAYELTPQDAGAVYKMVPANQQAAYHWINAGVDSHPGARLNPFTLLLRTYTADDVIVVKLDVDTASTELPLAQQLLSDPQLVSLVDHFYFEHHVHLEELARYWTLSMQGSVHDSLQLFHQLRQRGVAAHYWV